MSFYPKELTRIGGEWSCQFFDDFADPETLSINWFHPTFVGWRDNTANKWKWDGGSGKEIWWDKGCSFVVSASEDASENFLRVGVYTDWFHRCDRIATNALFGYGYYEAQVRFKGACNMHSAFWLLPDHIDDEERFTPDADGNIPGGIEVDVVEHRLCDSQGGNLNASGNTALHWNGYGANHQSVGWKVMELPGGNASEWMTFGLLHSEEGIRWYWGGQEVNRTHLHSPVPMHIYFSTEVTPGPCWSGACCPGSYGSKEDPSGYVDVKYCGFWQLVSEKAPGS